MEIEIRPAVFSAVSMFAAYPKEIRFYLRGVLLDLSDRGAFLVGCDGPTLAVAQLDDLPHTPAQFIMADNCIKDLAKWNKKDPIFLDVPHDLSGDHAAAGPDASKRRIVATSCGRQMIIGEIDGRFPDWRRVARPGPVVDNPLAFFDPQYVERVNDAGKLFGHKVTHIRPNGTGAGFAHLADDVFAIVMPMRVNLDDLPTGPEFGF